MAKKIIIILILFTNVTKSKAQYGNYNIKEKFDFIHEAAINYSENIFLPLSTNENNLERIAWMLESYIIMYKATHDKAYLYKFIDQAKLLINNRRSISRSVLNSQFTQTTIILDANWSTIFYQNGLTAWPLAHFVHLIYVDENSSLYNVSLIANYQSGGNYSTFGEFASWLGTHLTETYDEYFDNGLWAGDLNHTEGFYDVDFNAYLNHLLVINMVSPLAAGLLYLGHSYNNSYLTRAALLARRYREAIEFEDKCVCFNFNEQVFKLGSNNSYSWYHRALGIEQTSSCLPNIIPPCINAIPHNEILHNQEPNYSNYTQFTDDISHGISALIFPQACKELNLYTNGLYPFDNIDMTRFKNTFTKNIWSGTITDPQFHNKVNGTDDNVPNYGNTLSINYFSYAALSWMPFYKWDENTNEVYDILMNAYNKKAEEVNIPSLGNFINGDRMCGLAGITAAQWDKECFNLTIFNRNLNYDQDFSAKNKLIIDAGYLTRLDENGQPGHNPFTQDTKSFADPYFTDLVFKIQPSISSHMTAAESIDILPGFDSGGGIWDARIESSVCTDGNRMAGNAQQNNIVPRLNADSIAQISLNRHNGKIKTINSSLNSFSIAPNPNNGAFTLTSNNITSSIVITNILGEVVFRTQTIGNATEINLSNQSKGIYFVTVKGEGVGETKKVVVE